MTKPVISAKTSHPATIAPDTRKFYFKRERLSMLLMGVQLIQRRDDLSGAFSRKLARQARVMRRHVEDLQEESNATLDAHTVRFPEGHEKAGEPVPVYKTYPENNPDGSRHPKAGQPFYKFDKDGNETGEREIMPNERQLKDPEQYRKDVKALLEEIVEIEIQAYRTSDKSDANFVPELARFKAVNGSAIDFLLDLEEDSEFTQPPEGWAAAHEAASGPKLVTDDAPAVESSEPERTAP